MVIPAHKTISDEFRELINRTAGKSLLTHTAYSQDYSALLTLNATVLI